MAKEEGALWISPDNNIIPVDQTHIIQIMGNPEKFGLKKGYIESLYKKYNQPLGQEGKARDQIMTDLLKKGWIRVRTVPRDFSVTFQISDFKPTAINRVEKAIKEIIKKKVMDKNMSVKILNLNADDFLDKEDELTLAEIAAGAMRDKKYVNKSDAEEAEAKGQKRYTSLATMYHENVKFTFLKSIEEYKSYNNYLDEILNEKKEGK